LPDGVSDADGLVPYLAEILANTFSGEGVDVMGFSFGGMTAGLVAAQYPNLIRQLILVGAPGLGLFGKELPMRGMTPDMDEEAQRKVHRHNLNAMMFVHADSVTDEVIDLQQANVARDRLRRRRIARTDVLAQAQTHWTCPVHGVWGVCDALYQGTLAQVPQVLSSMASFTVVPDAGHWVMFEKPDAFHAAVAPLLSISQLDVASQARTMKPCCTNSNQKPRATSSCWSPKVNTSSNSLAKNQEPKASSCLARCWLPLSP
jgi:pimeloyl-ACP methyl ester carboxylesterase